MLQLAAAALNCKGGSPACASMMYSTTQKSMDSGYPLDWFVEQVDEGFICEICGKVLQSPRATPCCSNVFCLHCLEFWIEYYGVCPKRCGEIEADSLKKNLDIEKSIQALPVRCKNTGCKAKMVLEDKLKHEKKCQHKPQEHPNTDISDSERKVSVQSLDTYVEMASVACRNRNGVNETDSSRTDSRANLHPIFTRDLAYYTYNLTRRTQGESLGFVLVAGAKNSNGKAVNFSIKTVNPNTVAAEVGLLPGDRIVQVDNIPLSQLAQPEAISKIKDNPQVTLTIIRNNPMKKTPTTPGAKPPYHRRSIEDHVYEDIPNTTDQEKLREKLGGSTEDKIDALKRTTSTVTPTPGPSTGRHLNPPTSPHNYSGYLGDNKGAGTTNRLLIEKMSKDSGLSSGSSSTPAPNHSNRLLRNDLNAHHSSSKHSYRSEREAMKKSLHDRDLLENDQSTHVPMLYQEYEIEEIYLQKNGTNQLGITLGYDTKSADSHLIVCEIVADGLAAQDGRLRKGDIIQKVNGFQVYDPDEAILLFLEQDQDITLSVARKTKTRRRRHNLLTSKSQSSLDNPSGMVDGTELRRTDSCGSLDSMTHREIIEKPTVHSSQSRRHSDSSRRMHKTSIDSEMTFIHSPTITSSGYMSGPVDARVVPIDARVVPTDFMFRPINETRPATAGEITRTNQTRYLRSTTSLGSDPERSMGQGGVQFQQNPVARHRSFESDPSSRRLIHSPPNQQGNTGRVFGYSRAVSPLKNSSRSIFSDNSRMTDQVLPIDRVIMQRSISTFRCESLV